MMCEDVRVILAAYRRGEWSRKEEALVNDHLAGCAACRRWEAEARQVGERLRQLPTITPPASLRANVFAAIRADQIASANRAAEAAGVGLTRTPTGPLPITVAVASRPTQRIGEIGLRRVRPPRLLFGKVTAIGTVAALLALVVLTNIMSAWGGATASHQLPPAAPACLICPATPAKYSADPKYPIVTSVMADANQVVFVGQGVASQGTAGLRMLFTHERDSNTVTPLLAAPSATPLTIEALTADHLVLLVGAAPDVWSLEAVPFAATGVVAPFAQTVPTTLVSGGATLNGQRVTGVNSVWATKAMALVSLTLANTTCVLVRADFATAGAPRVTILTTTPPGHTITDPYLDGATAYWVDVTIGGDGAPHGVLWRQSATGLLSATSSEAFRPVAAQKSIAWFQQEMALPTADPATGQTTLSLIGSIVAQRADGATVTVSTGAVALANVWRGAGYLLWRDDNGMHVYHVATNQITDLSAITHALTVGVSTSAIAWATLPTDSVNAPSAIYVAGQN